MKEIPNSSFPLKKNYINKLISALEINGKITNDQSIISQEQTNFYQKLYSEKLNNRDPGYIESLNEFLANNNLPEITEEQKEFCNKTISEVEILNSIKGMSNGKSPGSDGLPTDFYKFFWTNIKHLLKDSILYAMNNGELSIEQRRGIITLLPKKHKNRLFLKNWRPITLLNTDYKIIAKILANRLKAVLPNIINDDQTGYIKDRYIGQNIRILEDVTFFTNQNQIPGILLSIDFEKAFDSLNWNILYKTLKNSILEINS